MPPWLDEFRPFSPVHAAAVAAFVAAVAALCAAGARLRSAGDDAPLRRAFAWAALAVVLAHQAYWLLPANFTWSRSLPLHVCDLAGWAAALAMLTGARLWRTLTYFWGLCLSSQGFITPVLTEGPAHPAFWFFFLSHAVIVGAAIYETIVGRYRPARRDWLNAILVTAAYAALMLALNLATGWNYAYVGPGDTSQPTVLDLLGPWPSRLIPMTLLAVAAFTLAWLPWEAARAARRAAQPPPPP